MKNKLFEKFRQNLNKLTDHSGLKKADIAEKVGVSPVTFSRLLSGYNTPERFETVYSIATFFGVSVEDLVNSDEILNKRSPLPSPEKPDFLKPVEVPEIHIHFGERPPECLDDKYRAVPLYESSAAATPDVIELASDTVIGYIIIENHYRYAGDLHAFKVRGDSMYPMLMEGDIVIIDKTQNDPWSLNKKAIYLCRYQDELTNNGLILKNAKYDPVNQILVLSSLNPEYDRMIITGDKTTAAIKGRVIKVIRDM
jgi:SOS-response transcriptional repressor LexA/DNA-binding XRE family transcriptional regulator